MTECVTRAGRSHQSSDLIIRDCGCGCVWRQLSKVRASRSRKILIPTGPFSDGKLGESSASVSHSTLQPPHINGLPTSHCFSLQAQQSNLTMYAQRPSSTSSSSHSIRKISPKIIAPRLQAQAPPCTQENWQHLVSIVMKLVQDKRNKDSIVTDLAERLTQMETTFDQGTLPNKPN